MRMIQVHPLSLALGAAFGLAVAVCTSFQNAPVPSVLTTRGIKIVSESGVERARLVCVGDDRVSFVLSDKGGQARATLSVDKSGPSLAMTDPDGRIVAALGSSQNSGMLGLRGEGDTGSGLELASSATGAQMILKGPGGKRRVQLDTEADGLTTMRFLDQNNRTRLLLSRDADGSPGVMVTDSAGASMLLLTADEEGAQMNVADSSGKSILTLPAPVNSPK